MFGWTATITHIVNSAFVIVIGLVLSYITTLIFKDTVIRKIIHYMIFAGAAVIPFSIFQENLVAVGISLWVLLRLRLPFIFQAPILDLVGWVYITVGRIYKKGDRVRVDNFKGDIVDINPMRTKILEVGEEYTASDLRAGES